jgi:hypothetical protein
MKRVPNVPVPRSQTTSFLWLSLVLFTAVAAAQSTQVGTSQNALIGAWKLVSLEEPSADGQVHKADCAGQFVFTK